MPRRDFKHFNLKKPILLCRSLKTDELYILWGISENSLALAESIRKAEKEKASEVDENVNKRNKIVFIATSLKEEPQKAKSLGARVCQSAANLPKKYKANAINIFLITDDEECNIDNTFKILDLFGKDKKVNIYCRANRRNEKAHQLELLDARNVSEAVANNKWDGEKKEEEALICTRIRIVDSALIAAEQLFCKEENLPINYVEIIPETASVKPDSAFKSMIIGFGEVGQAAFYHLYTLGAFVDSNGNKTPFHCTIIDKKENFAEEALLSKAPYFRNQIGDIEDGKELSFLDRMIDSPIYWRTVKKEIEGGVNYIVVSTGNDELNINTTIKLCSCISNAEQTYYSKCGRKMKVCVCLYDSHSKVLLQNALKAIGNVYSLVDVVSFGSREDIFNTDLINRPLLSKAIEFNCLYEKNGESAYVKWLQTFGAFSDKSEEDADFDKALCLANAMHTATKVKLLGMTGRPIEFWKNKLERNQTTNPDAEELQTGATYINPNLSNEEKDCLVNLGKLEHELWMAVAHLFGFQLAEKDADGIRRTDKSRKQHRDLVHWNELREWDKAMQDICRGYDCGVVDTTIRMELNNQDMNTRKKLEISETNAGSADSKDKNMLLAMWITCVEQAGDVSKRRDTMTNWFMVLQGALIAAIATILTKDYHENIQHAYYIILAIGFIGSLINIVWLKLIQNFKYLNKAKFDIILDIEKQLPTQAMADEWDVLTTKTKYENHTQLEPALPKLFIVVFVALMLFVSWLLWAYPVWILYIGLAILFLSSIIIMVNIYLITLLYVVKKVYLCIVE